MDTVIVSLPQPAADIFVSNVSIVETISMFAIGAFMAVDVALSTFNQFKRYRGLYFWSLQVASWGIVLHGVPAQMRYAQLASNISVAAPFVLGWWCMVQGQAVVLYSRLHLVVPDVRHIRWVLWMIIANFTILSVPMTALFLCQNVGTNPQCTKPAEILDKIQLCGFALQDLLICVIYICPALGALKPIFAMKGREGKRVIIQLIIINVIVVVLNISLVVIGFKLPFITVGYKTVVYAIKLKLEFYILTKLRELTRTYPCVCHTFGEIPRVSSDINIFDLLARGGGIAQRLDMEAQTSPRFGVAVSPSTGLPSSTRSSTYDFHDALRETMSASVSENSVGQSHLDGRLQVRSSDTRSTVEMALVEPR
ncbi:hypothetical protein N7508_006490 [Penicillium antarcticum]|uniref:uncharacterized protein n=1 Tax=Penicillium antarcticum TaxID=416450 RepID=UPI002386F863|nr:uncharacterized protein N7508_006490 [Penicillium antarcticum]KAJ5301627.1 hypothetical protein N7508_006490 [Penicillium antarcticum]